MDPDPVPALFGIDLQDANKVGTFTSFSKDKKSQRSQKILGIKVLLLVLLDDMRTRIQETQKCTDRIRNTSF
jgi:hypothetical protein